jgi:hypothetical protein
MTIKSTSRRQFLRTFGPGITALPIAALGLSPALAWAQSVPRLSENDPVAFALGYVHDAVDVDLSKYPRYESGQICANCQQWQGAPEEEWAPCAIIPGRLVSNPGWCSVWVRKAG